MQMQFRNQNNGSSKPTLERPNFLLALGSREVPDSVIIGGKTYSLEEVFKHDSWAATALYRCDDQRIVCKHNRLQSVMGLPLFWIGRYLAYRERWFLQLLEDLPGIPRSHRVFDSDGTDMKNAVAHDFIEGKPLGLVDGVPSDFFDNLLNLLGELHRRNIAYVDLHKAENVIVGDDGLPHLMDFQISAWLPKWFGFRYLFKVLAQSDLYHVEKHFRTHVPDHGLPRWISRPWWIRLHRAIAVPVRLLRRRFLVALGVRSGSGRAHTEVAPEVSFRKT